MYSSTLEVTEVAETLDLTVLATAKQELGIADSDTSQDTKLARWIHEASGQICAYCDRVLGRERVKETFTLGWHGYHGPLALRRWPVAQIDAVTSDYTQPLTIADYRYSEGGLLYRKYGRWVGDVVVQYQAGYQLLGELPYDLEAACLAMLRYRNSPSASRDPMIRSEEVPGVYSVSYWVGNTPGATTNLPLDVVDLLAPYRDVSI